MRRPILVLLLASACGPAAPPPVFAPEPAATVTAPSVPPAPSTPTTTDVAPAVPPPAPVVAADPCRGSSFDVDALPPCKDHQPGEPPSLTSKLVVSLVPSASTVRSGETIDVSVVFTNASAQPAPLDVLDGCSSFELGAYDASGVRKDYVVGACGSGGGCGGSNLRLVLEPGGTIVKHMHFTAHVVRRTPASGCNDVDAGGLPPGTYSLRATAYVQGGWLDAPVGAKGSKPHVSVPLQVTR